MKTLPWFRLYSEAVDDAKLGLLAFEDRWHFIAILCCKSQGVMDVDGTLAKRKLCYKLGLDGREFDEVIRRLSDVGLLDPETAQPLAWEARQFMSDSDPTNAARQSRFRAKKASNSVNSVTVTPTEQSREEQNRTDTASPDGFDLFWKAYPKRVGKPAALRAFKAANIYGAILIGVLADIAGRSLGAEWRQDGGKYIPHPSTYLNQRRWEDETVMVNFQPFAGAI